MTATVESPALAQPVAPADSFWTLLTVASLGKQIGTLCERFPTGSAEHTAILTVEAKLEGILLSADGAVSHAALLRLSQEIDRLK